jgi:hypothetical protein
MRRPIASRQDPVPATRGGRGVVVEIGHDPKPSHAQAALKAMVAIGDDPWNAKLTLLKEGAANTHDFPELKGVPEDAMVPIEDIWNGIIKMEDVAKWDPDGADAGLRAMLTGRVVNGFLNLEPRRWIRSLPAGLRVTQDLILERTGVRVLPDDLWVDGNVNLRGTAIRYLPKGMKVGGDLILEGTAVDVGKLPNDLDVGGVIHVRKGEVPRSLADIRDGVALEAAMRNAGWRP